MGIGRIWLNTYFYAKETPMRSIKRLLQESNAFYPEYLLAHHNKWNRVLHFAGATLFYCLVVAAFLMQNWWLLPIAVFTGYLLPGIGHRFLQQNHSFRSTKPVLCVICATRLYFDTLLLRTAGKLKKLNVH